MLSGIDFSIATSEQIAGELSKRLESIRLMRNQTQAQLAREAGISLKTLWRLENGQDFSFDTFVRVMIALRMQNNLQALLPDPAVHPVERVNRNIPGKERKRARPVTKVDRNSEWTWGDEGTGKG